MRGVYRYSNKGVSALLLREAADERYHRFTFTNWPAGVYSTASIAGSRSGGGVASAWAVFRYLGVSGYCAIVEQILARTQEFVPPPHTYMSIELFVFCIHSTI